MSLAWWMALSLTKQYLFCHFPFLYSIDSHPYIGGTFFCKTLYRLGNQVWVSLALSLIKTISLPLTLRYSDMSTSWRGGHCLHQAPRHWGHPVRFPIREEVSLHFKQWVWLSSRRKRAIRTNAVLIVNLKQAPVIRVIQQALLFQILYNHCCCQKIAELYDFMIVGIINIDSGC